MVQYFEFLTDDGSDPRCHFLRIPGWGSRDYRVDSCLQRELCEGAAIAEFMPEYAAAIERIRNRVLELLPCVRSNVYGPAFGGSYSQRRFYGFTALLPDMTY